MKNTYYRVNSDPEYFFVLRPQGSKVKVTIIAHDYSIDLGIWAQFGPIGTKTSFEKLPETIQKELNKCDESSNDPPTQRSLFD